MHIALFGGSFNPPHTGHVTMVRQIARRKGIEQIWIFPTWRHPFGKKLAPYALRRTLCRLAFVSLSPKVKIKDIEKRLGGKSWTVKTLRYLIKRYPQHSFSWVMGRDSYRERGQWKDFKSIEQNCRLIVFPRGPTSPIPNISSTALRRQLQKGMSPPRGLPRKVATYLSRTLSPLGREKE